MMRGESIRMDDSTVVSVMPMIHLVCSTSTGQYVPYFGFRSPTKSWMDIRQGDESH
jgi:hypothetical protein